MFFNELAINNIIADPQFALNFPKLIVFGYWDGLPDRPMDISEYLGKEMPLEEWDRYTMYRLIKSRLEEINLLEISHKDDTDANIHLSESCSVTLQF